MQPTCFQCGSKETIEIHHIDRNPGNNDPANLQPLCRRCHKQTHVELRKQMTPGTDPRHRPKVRRVTMNLSLSPEEQRIARELAERKHGGNVSRLFQKLLRLAWAMEQEESERKVA